MLRSAPDFHYALARADHAQRFAQLSPQYDQVGEVTIFRNECRRGHASRSKDIAIFGPGQTQIPNLNAGLAKLVPNPTRQRRGEMIIEPNRHYAAIIG